MSVFYEQIMQFSSRPLLFPFCSHQQLVGRTALDVPFPLPRKTSAAERWASMDGNAFVHLSWFTALTEPETVFVSPCHVCAALAISCMEDGAFSGPLQGLPCLPSMSFFSASAMSPKVGAARILCPISHLTKRLCIEQVIV